MTRVSIAAISERFPLFRVAFLRASGLTVQAERSTALDQWIGEAEATCRTQWRGVELSAIPGVAAWRGAYRGFGVKKTSYRSSVERLIKRVLAGEALPRVNSLVDLYNCVSLVYGLCLGADDLDKTFGDLAFRFSEPSDSFIDMGAEPGEDPNDPPKEGEVIYADARHVLCRRWNWRQDARTMMTPETTSAVLTIQSNGHGDVAAAAQALADGVGREGGGQATIVMLDRETPTATL